MIGNLSAPVSILYADITSPVFGKFHQTLIQTAREGKTSYRLRHKKPLSFKSNPILISGYGVELALKRTDYIVIDDRNDEDLMTAEPPSTTDAALEDEDLADLKPLSTSELVSLSLKASSFVMQSDDPLETLFKLSQNFPKYSSALAAYNTTVDFLTEHHYNRELMLPAGTNAIWINGVQLTERQVDAFSILDILRRERRLIGSVRGLGMTGPQAIDLLSHSALAKAKRDDEPQRFDWRDDLEGSNIIIWLNDIEKDRRYESWSADLKTVSYFNSYSHVALLKVPSYCKEHFQVNFPLFVKTSSTL